jgi:hypothetical protein
MRIAIWRCVLLRLLKTTVALSLALLSLASFPSTAAAQLETRATFSTNPSPASITTGDFNRDGKMDLAVASILDSFQQVQVFLGSGDGTFAAPASYGVGNIPRFISAIDLNHDGNLDLVVATGDDRSGGVSVLLGNGDGTFQPAMNFDTVAQYPIDLVFGDFNGDHKIDVAMPFSFCACLGVLLGNGDGTFREPPIFTNLPSFSPQALAAGYFKGDGNLDLAVSQQFGSSSGIQILLGNGDGTFRIGGAYPVGPSPEALVAVDLNKDQKTDLAVAEFQGIGVAVLLGNGDGTFLPAVEYPVDFALSVTFADMNGDGVLDLVLGSNPISGGAASVLLGNGDGTFQPAMNFPAGLFSSFAAVGDFNGDHRTDVAVADYLSNTVEILLNTGVVAFSPTTPLNFQGQRVGTTSKPKTVTLSNTGLTALSISSRTVKGPYAMTSTCGVTVAPGASCAIRVTFSPKTEGPKAGSVAIIDSASTKPQVIKLSGTGT